MKKIISWFRDWRRGYTDADIKNASWKWETYSDTLGRVPDYILMGAFTYQELKALEATK